MLTPKQKDYLNCLCFKARFFDIEQTARGWFGGRTKNHRRNAKRFVQDLTNSDWTIAKDFMVSLPRPEITAPLFRWDPACGELPVYDAEKISYQCVSRFANTRLGTRTLFCASRKARRLFGGPELTGGWPARFDQINHDAIVSDIVLLLKADHRRQADYEELRGEDVYKRWFVNSKLPDLQVCGDEYANPSVVLDSLGAYSSRLIESFINLHGREEPKAMELY